MNRTSWYINNTFFNWFFTFGDYNNLQEIKKDVEKPYDNIYNMEEVRTNTEDIWNLNSELYHTIIQYNSGHCEFNEKKSQGKMLFGKNKKMYLNMIESIKIVKPISNSINLFHGFEWFLSYPKFIKDKIITFNFCLSKTPCYHVAAFFAKTRNPFVQRYMYVKYPAGTKHLSPDVRMGFNDEYEYLSVNEKLKFIDTVYQISLLPWPSISIYYVFQYVGLNI